MTRRWLLLLGLLATLAAGERAPAEARYHPSAIRRLLDAWRFEEASEQAKAFIAATPANPVAQALYGEALYHFGEYGEALNYLNQAREALNQEPSFADLYRRVQAVRDATVSMIATASPAGHFVVYTARGPDRVLSLYALDVLEAAYREIGRDLDYFPPGKVRVEIYERPADLAAATGLLVGDLENSGTIAITKFNRIMLISPRNLTDGYAWADTLAHEYTHHLLGRKTYNELGLWLHEGLARFEEARWSSPEPTPVSHYGGGLLHWALLKPQERLIPFAAIYPSMAKLPSQDKTALAFAEVHLAARYLFSLGGYPLLRALLNDVRDGVKEDVTVSKITGQPFSRFDGLWQMYARRQSLPPPLAPGDMPTLYAFIGHGAGGVEQLKKAKEPQAVVHLRLAEILQDRRRLKASAEEFRRAVERASAPDPMLYNRYARVLLEIGDYSRAAGVLHRLVATGTVDGQGALNLARLATGQKQFALAVQYYAQANHYNPFSKEIHRGWLNACKQLDDAQCQEREKEALALLLGQSKPFIREEDAIEAPKGMGLLLLRGPRDSRVVRDNDLPVRWDLPLDGKPLAEGRHILQLQVPGEAQPREIAIDVRAGKKIFFVEP